MINEYIMFKPLLTLGGLLSNSHKVLEKFGLEWEKIFKSYFFKMAANLQMAAIV